MDVPQPRGDELNQAIIELEAALTARFTVSAGECYQWGTRKAVLRFDRGPSGGRLVTWCPNAKARVPLVDARIDARCEATNHLVGLVRALVRAQEAVCNETEDAIEATRKMVGFLKENPS